MVFHPIQNPNLILPFLEKSWSHATYYRREGGEGAGCESYPTMRLKHYLGTEQCRYWIQGKQSQLVRERI